MSAFRSHYLGGRTIARTTPWASAYMTADVVREIAELAPFTVTLFASGPRGPFEAQGGGTHTITSWRDGKEYQDVYRGQGRTVIAAVKALVAQVPTEAENREMYGR